MLKCKGFGVFHPEIDLHCNLDVFGTPSIITAFMLIFRWKCFSKNMKILCSSMCLCYIEVLDITA